MTTCDEHELFGVFSQICSEDERDDAVGQLESLLRADEANCLVYIEYCEMHAMLAFDIAANDLLACTVRAVSEEVQQASDTPTPQVAIDSRFRRAWHAIYDVASNYITLSLVVSGLFFAILLLSMALIVPDWKQFVPGNEPKTPSMEFVAHISATSKAEFDETSEGNFKNRDLFADDQIVLNAGLVVIEYDTGARVVLEGPATYQIQGANGGDLQHGKLVARCDTINSKGFIIATPSGWVEDLGTEFGVEVLSTGAEEYVVLSGKVDVVRENDDGSEQRIRLVNNQGAFFAAGGEAITRRKVADVRWVTVMRSWLEVILEEPPSGLVAHYEFESAVHGRTPDSSGNGHTGTLRGDASIVNDSMRGNVYQPRFQSGSHVDIDSTFAIPSLPAKGGATLAVWVRRRNVTIGEGGAYAGALALGRRDDYPVMMISVTNDGAVCGFIEGDKRGVDQVRLTGPVDAVANGVWTHIAITFDRAGNVAKMYVNGTQSGEGVDISLAGDGMLDWAGANVGCLDPSAEEFFFPGLIDDARIYYKVLTAAEVQELFDKTNAQEPPMP